MDDTSQRIGASAQQLIASLTGSKVSTSSRHTTNPVTAIERAKILAGCYRKDDAADPETYLMAVSAVLAEYAPDIVSQVTDPRSGLPSRLNWLPSVKEVRDACEEIDQRRRRMAEAAAREREQLEARRKDEAAKAIKPTLEQLRDKYGPNWGLAAPVEEDTKRITARRALLEQANRDLFLDECRRAGVDPAGGVSPSLIRSLKQPATRSQNG